MWNKEEKRIWNKQFFLFIWDLQTIATKTWIKLKMTDIFSIKNCLKHFLNPIWNQKLSDCDGVSVKVYGLNEKINFLLVNF